MFQIDSEIPATRRSYKLEGGKTGVLMLHGFMGSPASSRPLAEFLHSHGLTVHCPRLAGHGHLPAKLHRIHHRQWLQQERDALAELGRHCSTIFLIGHSMGCVAGANLLVCEDASAVAGFAMIAPLYRVPRKAFYAMPLLRRFLPFLYPLNWKLVERDLIERRVLDFDPTIDLNDPEVKAWLNKGTRLPTSALDEMRKMTALGRKLWRKIQHPVLILQGGEDEAINPALVHRIFSDVKSTDKSLHFYPHAGHELIRSFDPNHNDAWRHILSFIQQRS